MKKLKYKPYGHDLSTLWQDYKAAVSSPNLNRFDSVVTELDRWEDLRYGGFPHGHLDHHGLPAAAKPARGFIS